MVLFYASIFKVELIRSTSILGNCLTAISGDWPKGLRKFLPLSGEPSLKLISIILVMSRSLHSLPTDFRKLTWSLWTSIPGIELHRAIYNGSFETSRSASGTTKPLWGSFKLSSSKILQPIGRPTEIDLAAMLPSIGLSLYQRIIILVWQMNWLIAKVEIVRLKKKTMRILLLTPSILSS